MYRLKPHRTIAHELKRVADKQLARAVEGLGAIDSFRADAAVYDARRHIKKVRAMLRLVRPAMGDAYSAADRRLRAANRWLAPIADGRAVVDTISRVSRRPGDEGIKAMLASVREALVERVARADRKARLDRVLPRVARTLAVERACIADWTLNARGVDAIAPGLGGSVRRARKAMGRASRHPTPENYHTWRQRTKDLWLHVRLVEGRCGRGLGPVRRRLEALDECLGEYHNVVLLEQILVNEALASRPDTAAALRVLRAYQGELRARGRTLGAVALAQSPKQFVRRVISSWSEDRPVRVSKRPKTTPRAA